MTSRSGLAAPLDGFEERPRLEHGGAAVPSSAPLRTVLFVNSGILGHRAVGSLMRDAAAAMPSVRARHIDLSGGLTPFDRIVRAALSFRLAPAAGPAANLDVRRWRQELNAGLLAARRIDADERRHGPAGAIHFHTQATAYASLGRMRRTPSIVSIDTTQRLASLEAQSAASRLSYLPSVRHDRRIFHAAAAIVATSDWAARDLEAHDPALGPKLHVLPYPTRFVLDASIVRERFEREQRRGTSPVRVLFVGGDFPRKGGRQLLEAWTAGGFASCATLDLVTGWPIPAPLPPGVRLIADVAPHTPQWTALWREADLFVMPTRHEAFGMVFQEAAAAALPVVGTRINAVPEIVAHGRTGLLVERDDAGALVAAMRTLIASPDERLRLGAAAREMAAERWAPARYAARLESLIQRVTGNHGLSR